MSLYSVPLLAGQPHTIDAVGELFLIDDIGVAASIDIAILQHGKPLNMPNRKQGFRYGGAFDGVTLLSAVDSTVAVFISLNDVQMIPDGVRVRSAESDPVHVTFTQQIVPLGSVKVENNLTVLVDIAPVSVGVAATALVSDATLKLLVIRNSHANAVVAIGGAGVTLANAARVLSPGDVWTEDDAPGAALYAISDTAATSVQVSGAK